MSPWKVEGIGDPLKMVEFGTSEVVTALDRKRGRRKEIGRSPSRDNKQINLCLC